MRRVPTAALRWFGAQTVSGTGIFGKDCFASDLVRFLLPSSRPMSVSDFIPLA